ncbi:MAG: class I SAM-dependent methyltransferase, partial [Planctomycetes bacterium]|nr:class I SAM-dependent methyltransferase [Planctomycetota bacterium]
MPKNTNQRFHDRISGRYDAIYDDDPYHLVLRDLTLARVKPHLPKDFAHPLLDAGCGTGWFGARFLKSGYAVDFLDLSQGMLDQARARVDAEKPRVAPEFFHGGLEQIETLTTKTYALVIAIGDILSFVDDPVRTLRSVAKRMTDGAVFVGTVDQKLAGLEHFLERGDLDALARFAKDGKTVWLGGTKDERFATRMYTAEEIRDVFDKAGFDVVDIAGKTILPLRDARDRLEDPKVRRELLELERKLQTIPSALGRASHLEVL